MFGFDQTRARAGISSHATLVPRRVGALNASHRGDYKKCFVLRGNVTSRRRMGSYRHAFQDVVSYQTMGHDWL